MIDGAAGLAAMREAQGFASEVEAAGLSPQIDWRDPRYVGDVVAYVFSWESVPGTFGHPCMERVVRLGAVR